ncbi:MAG TPA: hypothetical protein VGI45_23030 [Terracidiphilus sp.]|jgi:hypothetical protein
MRRFLLGSIALCLFSISGTAQYPGVTSDGANGLTITGNVGAASVNASVNTQLNPMSAPFNATGSGTTDDFPAFQAMRTACPTSGCSMVLPAKTFAITGGIFDVAGSSSSSAPYSSLIGAGRGSTISCSPATTQEACVRVYNGARSTIQNLTINCSSNVTYCIEYISTGAAEEGDLRNVSVSGGQYSIGVSPTAHFDIAHITMSGVSLHAAAIADLVVGDGVQSNVLDIQGFGMTIDTSLGDGVLIRGGGWRCYGCDYDSNTGTDVNVTTPPDQYIVLSGGRSENSTQYFKHNVGSSAYIPGVLIEGVSWFGNSSSSTAISANNGESITIRDSRFSNAAGNVTMSFGHTSTSPTVVTMKNVGIANTGWASVLTAMQANAGILLSSCQDYYAPSSFVGSPGSGLCFSPNTLMLKGVITTDSSGDVTTNGNLSSNTLVADPVGGFGSYSNSLLYSAFDGSSLGTTWGIPFPTALTCTTGSNTDPFARATTIETCTAANPIPGGTNAQQNQAGTSTSGVSYAVSIYLRGHVGGESVSMGVANASDAQRAVTLPNDTAWHRECVLVTPTSTRATIAEWVINTPGAAVDAWGVQVEQAPSCGIYVHTTSAVQSLAYGYVDKGDPITRPPAGTTASIGGSALTPGTCATGTVTVTGATTSMAVVATPTSYPGDAFDWKAYVSSSNTVTVSVCTNLAAGGTPTASAYNVRVIP